MVRLIRPVLWVGGTVLLMAALLWPFLKDALWYDDCRKEAEQLVEQIVRLEERHFLAQESFLPFTRQEMPATFRAALTEKGLDRSRFVFDVSLAGEAVLVTRAMTRDALLQTGEMPLMVFIHKKHLNSNKVEREWIVSPH